MPKLKKNSLINKNITILAIIVFLLTLSGIFLYLKKSGNSIKPTDSSTSPEDINLGPPTDQDKKEAENHKERLSNSSDTTTSSANGNVTPVITSWGQSNGKVEVAARVPGILEEGGLCTLTLKRNNEAQTGTSNAIANVSEVSCGFIAIARSSLTAGEWSATVTYYSSKASGTSEAKSVVVE